MPTRVLVVDDALIMRRRISDIAKESGWEIAGEAADGQQAIELYSKLQPDLVTMDIVMPVLDGVEALRAIRQAFPQARVCMVSALNQSEKLSECIRLGAIDFIVKPFDKKRLQSLFERQGKAS